MKIAQAGTLESNDIFITITKSDSYNIELTSSVYELYGDDIKQVITNECIKQNIDKINIKAIDNGAIDYTIKARIKSAIKRYKS